MLDRFENPANVIEHIDLEKLINDKIGEWSKPMHWAFRNGKAFIVSPMCTRKFGAVLKIKQQPFF